MKQCNEAETDLSKLLFEINQSYQECICMLDDIKIVRKNVERLSEEAEELNKLSKELLEKAPHLKYTIQKEIS